MRLKEFFVVESAGPTFKSPEQLTPEPKKGAERSDGMEDEAALAPERNRLESLPTAVQGYVREIERMCTKLNRHNEGDPDLKALVHKFLLDLNKWQAEEPR